MDALETVKVSSRGQIVIPEAMRKALEIGEGEKLIMLQQSDSILVKKEEVFLRSLSQSQEKTDWFLIAEENLKKVWDNKKDDEVWSRY